MASPDVATNDTEYNDDLDRDTETERLRYLRYLLKTKESFDEDDLSQLQEFLTPLSDKWPDLGAQLGVESNKLTAIQQEFPNDNKDALGKLLMICVEESLDWDKLSVTLKSPSVDGGFLLESEERPLFDQDGDQAVRSKLPSEFSLPFPSDKATSSTQNVQKVKPPFYANGSKSKGSNLSNLLSTASISESPSTQYSEASIKMIGEKIKDLKKSFDSHQESITDSFNKSQVSLDQIQQSLMSIPVASDMKLGDSFKELAAKILKCASIKDLFALMSRFVFWDYLNPGLLRFLIGELGSQNDKSSMETYLNKLNRFRASVTFGEYIRAVTNHTESKPILRYYSRIVAILDGEWEDKTLQNMEDFKLEVSEECHIRQTYLTQAITKCHKNALIFYIPIARQIESDRASICKLDQFFKRRSVGRVYLGDTCLDWLVSSEVSLALQLKFKASFDSGDIIPLLHLLMKLSHKWYDIGVQLEMEEFELKDVQQRSLDSKEALRGMLSVRLKRPFTWEDLYIALKSPAVNGGWLLDTESTDEVVKSKVRTPSESFASPASSLDPNPKVTSTEEPVQEQSSILGYEKLTLKEKNKKVDHTLKVLLVGDINVGKTSLIRRFNKASFQQTSSTSSALTEFEGRVVRLPNGETVNLKLSDTSGFDRQFNSIPRSVLRKIDAALVIFDISTPKSFERVDTWVERMRKDLDDNVVIILVGNSHRKVDSKVAEEYASRNKLEKYIETSSKEDINVDQVFFWVCQSVLGRDSYKKKTHRSDSNEAAPIRLEIESKPTSQYKITFCSC